MAYPKGRIRDRGPIPEKIRQKFLDRMTQPTSDECCRWTGNINSHGYGYITESQDGHRTIWLVHHIAWVVWDKEPLPTQGDRVVAHTEQCQYRDCVNPRHLMVMSYQQHREMMSRLGKAGSRGNPKITAEIAAKIIVARVNDKLTYREIAERFPAVSRLENDTIIKYPLSRSQIIKICCGESWADHRSEPPDKD